MAIRTDSKPSGTVSLEEIKKNIVELQYRFLSLTNPEYEIHELFDPVSQTMRSVRLTRVEWWEEWKRQERFLSFAQRIPFKRLGEVRASTDDHCFSQISKILEDLTVQVDLLSQFLALQVRSTPIEQPVRVQNYDLPILPASPISNAVLAQLPDDDEEDDEGGSGSDDEEADAGGGMTLEEVDDDEDY